MATTDPKIATQGQWEDLASKVKGKAPNTAMTGATSGAAGTTGLVPAPAAGDNTKFLKGDGTWAEAGGGGDGTITEVQANGTSVATSGVANIPAASTSAYGVTKLTNSTSSTSTTTAATPSSVKSAYDLANGKAAVTMTTTDPGEGATLAANNFIGVYNQPGYVETADISNLAVTTGKLANSAVTTAKINDGAVTSGKLASNAVTTAKINNGAVTSAKIDFTTFSTNTDFVKAGLIEGVTFQANGSSGGFTTKTYGTPFPTGVTPIVVAVGDVQSGHAASVMITASLNTGFTYLARTTAGSNNTNCRIHWIAINPNALAIKKA